MKSYSFLFLLLFFAACLLPVYAGEQTPPQSPEVAEVLQPYLDQHKIAGYIAVIADRTGKVRFKTIRGYADVENQKNISEDNVFWIASMTKMFAGASIMMLADEGKVSLDDPVSKYIKSEWMVVKEKDENHILLEPVKNTLTIRHLLSHTSGLTGMSELQRAAGSDGTPLKARAIASVTGPLQWQPGEKYQYGNQGMNIAARIVEIVSGIPYQDFLQQRFFDPLGMTETTFFPNGQMIDRLAGAYGRQRDGGGLNSNGFSKGSVDFLTKPYSDRSKRFPEAGGGLFSTTHDILQYGLMLANDGEWGGKRYLSRESIKVLQTKQTDKTDMPYSLGYHLRNGMFGHDGAYGTDLSVNPKTGLIAVFMVQCTGGDQWEARDKFLKVAAEVFDKP